MSLKATCTKSGSVARKAFAACSSPAFQRKPRVSVIRVDHGHDAAATGVRTPGRLDGNVDGLPSATGKDRVVGTGRRRSGVRPARHVPCGENDGYADVEGFPKAVDTVKITSGLRCPRLYTRR